MKKSVIWISSVIIFLIILSIFVVSQINKTELGSEKAGQNFEKKISLTTQPNLPVDKYLDYMMALHNSISDADTQLPPQTEEEVFLQRTQNINDTIEYLENERDTHGGSWDVWYESLALFRKDIQSILDNTPKEVIKMGMLPVQDGYIYTQHALEHAVQEAELNFRRDEIPVVSPLPSLIHLSKEFKRRGIDFIYIPVPMNLDIYPEHVSGNYPKNGIATPYLRKLFYELLKSDVEVIDLMPIFLDAKGYQHDINLYSEKDIHWSNEAVQISALYIAYRLERYPFVREAQRNVSLFKTEDVVDSWYGKYISKLENREKYPLNDYTTRRVIMPNGEYYTDSDDPEIVIMGDSFAYYYQINYGKNGGIAAHLARFTGVPIKQITSSGMMPIELIRRFKEVLTPNVKVVLYVQDTRQLRYSIGWELVPFPEQDK